MTEEALPLAGVSGRRLVAGMILAVCLPASLARAQTPAGEAPRPDRADLTLAVEGRYSSNAIFGTGGGESEGDYITSLRAALSAGHRTSRTDWGLDYRPLYTRYHPKEGIETTHLEGSNHALDFRSDYLLSRRLKLAVRERLFYSQDPTHVISPGTEDAPVLTRQTRRLQSTADASVDLDLSRFLSLELGTSARFDQFRDPSLADSQSYAGRLGITRRLGREHGLTATYLYSRFMLGNVVETDPLTGNPVLIRSPDVDSHGVEVSWSREIPERSELRVSSGGTVIRQEEERRNRVTGSVFFQRRYRRATFLSGYRRGLSADTGTENVALAQNAYGGLSGGVGRRVTFGLFADYGTRESVLEGDDPSLAASTRLDLSYYGAALRGGLALNDRFSLSGEASRRKQEVSSGSGSDGTVDGFVLGVAFKLF